MPKATFFELGVFSFCELAHVRASHVNKKDFFNAWLKIDYIKKKDSAQESREENKFNGKAKSARSSREPRSPAPCTLCFSSYDWLKCLMEIKLFSQKGGDRILLAAPKHVWTVFYL